MIGKLFYVTGNPDKVRSAKRQLDRHGIEIEARPLTLIEEQSDSIEKIALTKAAHAYEQVGKPLLVNDTGWAIPALNGFPGPFMAYLKKWFTPEDFLNLMRSHTDRRIFQEQVVVFIDDQGSKVFKGVVEGEILKEARGKGELQDLVISLSRDGKSIAEYNAEDRNAVDNPLWEEFAKWYLEYRDHK